MSYDNSDQNAEKIETSGERTSTLPEGERDQRIIVAYEAALAVASEVAPEAVLQRIVDVARMVGSARYAALGVANDEGKLLQFITSGVTDEQRAKIGPLPEGHGFLGELIRGREPIMVEDLAADPR